MKIKLRKRLSAGGLLEASRIRFSRIHDPLAGKTRYPLTNCLMSALAMFGLKYPSLLQFDNSQEDALVRHNLATLYGVPDAPSDTYMRERLDEVNPEALQPAFSACFRAVQRGKVLPLYTFLEDYYLVSNDGTGIFHSDTVHCAHCCVKHHRKGGESYYHQMMSAVLVHPCQSVVLPLSIEPILKEDGPTKNDCERNASKRLLTKLRRMHPKLKMVIVEDALHSNGPHITLLNTLNYQYIIGVKPTDHRWLFDWIEAGGYKTSVLKREGFTYAFRWFNDVPLNGKKDSPRVNFLACEETSPKGKQQRFSWVTSFQLTEGNVYDIMRGARARWKIEIETFNTLKTQGYHFEHNFGHGQHQLSTVLGYLMMLAFLIDQIQQLCCPQFQAALKKCRKRTRLWERIRHWFLTFLIESWEDFFEAIALPPDFRLRWDAG